MTGKLAAFRPSDLGLVVKKEEGDPMTWSQPSGCDRHPLGLGKDKENEGDEDDISDVEGWREGGLLRAEWLKKDRYISILCASYVCLHLFLSSIATDERK